MPRSLSRVRACCAGAAERDFIGVSGYVRYANSVASLYVFDADGTTVLGYTEALVTDASDPNFEVNHPG